MAMVDTDWSIDRATGNIRYTGYDHDGTTSLPNTTGGARPATYATVIEFHRWLQDKADDASAIGDDELDIVSINPSARSTDNYITLLGSYNIDDVAAEHLYDGSIVQANGDVIYDGIVNFGSAGVKIMLHQNGAVLGNGTAWWNANGGLNADAAQGITHRFMIKVRTGGADIDGRRLVGLCRTLDDTNQNTYGEFTINGTSRGNNVLALSDSNDLNNTNTATTIATWDKFANLTAGWNEQDIDLNGTNEGYWSEWSRSVAGTLPATATVTNLYEYAKYLTRDGSAETLYGLSGELFRGVTHVITYDNLLSGTFTESNSVTFGNGAKAQVLADNNTNTMWVQLLSGVAPADNDTISDDFGTATADVLGTPVAKALNYPFIGTSTGSAIIAAYGVGFKAADLSKDDQIFQLYNNGEQIIVPNNVSFSVTGLVANDRVLVAPYSGGNDVSGNPAVQLNQFTLAATLNTDNVASVTVTGGSLPTDTPASGTIRVQDDQGFYRRLKYSSYDSSTGVFTIDTTYHSTSDAPANPTNTTDNDFLTVNATAGNNLFISYVDDSAAGDTISFTSVYLADRDLVVKVRDGGASPIKEFIQVGGIKNTSQTVPAIRTTDL